MYSCILVANDGSTLGRKAFRHGLQLASHLRARLAVVVAIEPVVGLFGVTGTSGSNKNNNAAQEELQARSEAARLMLDDCALIAAGEGISCQTEIVNLLTLFFKQVPKLRLISLLWPPMAIEVSGSGFWGSQTSEVLARSETPVLVVR